MGAVSAILAEEDSAEEIPMGTEALQVAQVGMEEDREEDMEALRVEALAGWVAAMARLVVDMEEVEEVGIVATSSVKVEEGMTIGMSNDLVISVIRAASSLVVHLTLDYTKGDHISCSHIFD